MKTLILLSAFLLALSACHKVMPVPGSDTDSDVVYTPDPGDNDPGYDDPGYNNGNDNGSYNGNDDGSNNGDDNGDNGDDGGNDGSGDGSGDGGCKTHPAKPVHIAPIKPGTIH